MFRLDGKVALITGAAGGIGDKIARTLHAQGAILALTDMREEPMLKLKSELGDNVEVFTANLTNADGVEISGNANANSSSISSITGSWQNAIQNALQTFDSPDFTSGVYSLSTEKNEHPYNYTFYAKENYTYYLIKEADDLASLAYYVNSGNTTYNSTTVVYILTANIDLGSKLWTPIGTYNHPFDATFIGAGHKISNVRVNDLTVENGTDNGAGLFGNVDQGNISDLVLGGTYSIDTTYHQGNLVGRLAGQVINCYHEESVTGTFVNIVKDSNKKMVDNKLNRL